MQNTSGTVMTRAEKQVIALIRAVENGKVRIIIKDKHPIRVETIKTDISLKEE